MVDLLYVLYEAVRLIRAMAELYGGRPGTLGMFRLLRDVLAHLAVTGSIAVGDSWCSRCSAMDWPPSSQPDWAKASSTA